MSHKISALFAIFVAAWTSPHVQAQSSSSLEHALVHDTLDQLRLQLRVAQACTARASHNQLRAFCQKQITDRTSKIDQLLRWSRQWHSTDIAEHRNIMKDPAVKKLLSFKKTLFDLEYLKTLRSLKDQARSLLTGCRQTAARDELRQFCSEVEAGSAIEDQAAEQLRSQWSKAF